MSCYSQYRGKSIGRQLHYIQEYCGLHFAELVLFGGEGKEITYHGQPFATVEWRDTEFKGVQIPWFTFLGQYEPFKVSQENSKWREVSTEDIARELAGQLEKACDILGRVMKIVPDQRDDAYFRVRVIQNDTDRFLADRE